MSGSDEEKLKRLRERVEQRTELERGARNVWQALTEVGAYVGDLDSIPGGQAVARKIRQDLERAFDWVSELMHPEDIDD